MPKNPDDGAPLGPCWVCGRPMVAGPSVDRHHTVPRSEGGRVAVPVHRICHRKVHEVWTERELAALAAAPEAVRAHPEVDRFVRWLRRKPPEFWAPTRSPSRRRGGVKR